MRCCFGNAWEKDKVSAHAIEGKPSLASAELKLTLAAPLLTTSTRSADNSSAALTARLAAASEVHHRHVSEETPGAKASTVTGWSMVRCTQPTAFALQCRLLQCVLPNQFLQHC